MIKVSSRTRGFTLVEILIVVVILGILAAIVIPQFTNASQEASASSLKSQLQTVRSQIELMRVKHNGFVPDFEAEQWVPLTDPATYDPAWTEGPYLQSSPINPFTGNSLIVAGTSHLDGASATDGWVWDNATGRMYAVGFDEVTNTYTEQ